MTNHPWNKGLTKDDPRVALNAKRSKSLPERFWEKVHKKSYDDCWIWIGAINEDGYGNFSENNKTIRAHRMSWKLLHGDAGELSVLHTCDNPKCVNPKHLFLGTQDDNVKDMFKKKRQSDRKGENNGNNKLTQSDVKYILTKLNEGVMGRTLARQFGVSDFIISAIKLRKNWSHLS